MDYKEISIRLTDRWEEVLLMYGISVPKMKGKNSVNGPCPLCNGNDRAHWRNESGRLALFCRSCAADLMKSPEDVIMEACGIDFSELYRNLLEFVGGQSNEDIKKAQTKAAAVPKVNMPKDHKQDHNHSVQFLEELGKTSRHSLFNRFSIQYPFDIPYMDNSVYFPVENKQGAVINVFGVSLSDDGEKISTLHLAGGMSYGGWHKIPKCDHRKPDGITWTTSVITGIDAWWITGKEVRVVLDVYNLLWMINSGYIAIGDNDDMILTDSERELIS